MRTQAASTWEKMTNAFAIAQTPLPTHNPTSKTIKHNIFGTEPQTIHGSIFSPPPGGAYRLSRFGHVPIESVCTGIDMYGRLRKH